MKLKNVRIVILKVLTWVRTHLEELLAPKFDFRRFLSTKGQECSFEPYDKKPSKSYFWDEKFFRMSSYTFKNFQLFIPYNFQFDYVFLKRLPLVLNPIFDFFQKYGQKRSNLIFSRIFYIRRIFYGFRNFYHQKVHNLSYILHTYDFFIALIDQQLSSFEIQNSFDSLVFFGFIRWIT